MPRPHQELRPSQFILTYGPGSILETGSGPVVLRTLDRLFTDIRRQPSEFEIFDDRLSRMELGGSRIVRIPTNAELGVPVNDAIYSTERFPFWCLCIQHRPQVLYSADAGCPQCAPMSNHARYEKAGREVIRFVVACPAGHLDEVNWRACAHGQVRGCRGSRHYLWHGGGRSLRFVELECPQPQCGARGNLGQAYNRPWPCTGRYPEQGARPPQSTCTQTARMLQRGAASLHLPNVVSALTIVDMPTRLHAILTDSRVLASVKTLRQIGMLDQSNFIQAVSVQSLHQATINFLQQTPWTELEDAINQLLASQQGTNRTLVEDEFLRLERAATNGAPPVAPAQIGAPPMFEVPLSGVRRFHGPNGVMQFRISPVTRLRMVLVQKGYVRPLEENSPEVRVGFEWGGQTWYPGVELFGEGIFIDLAGAELPLSGSRFQEWMRSFNASNGELINYPAHVWWHSLSHRLLRALSIDSGYSTASIRERVYLTFDQQGRILGGLLLYTVQPGGDGTLGGLVALVDRFDQILQTALQDVDNCSNDPLCEEAPEAGAAGSACYSCLLVSETSCEHRNMGLDRLLLMENRP